MTPEIHYLKGDATRPVSDGRPIIIAHVTNDIGAWGKGFVVPLGQRYPLAKELYKRTPEAQVLGAIQFVEQTDGVIVANMCAQHDIRSINGFKPIRYSDLGLCLCRLGIQAKRLNASVHMPRIACGLAGGTWDVVEPLIKDFVATQCPVYVYDLVRGI
jgi:O-acetyl-ADP-ribose deacetylase (regulator of RNase III)